jgi:hypothetical protein
VIRGEIVGRDEELRSLSVFLDRTGAGPAALVLEGEAGIGKSTLWLAGVEAARERGFRVLSARTAEAEQGLAHAGLGDLFEDTLELVVPALSAPRRRALEVALLVEPSTGRSVDPRTLGVALRNAVEVLAPGVRLFSRSTTSSGSTAPRRARSRSRCDAWETRRSSSCSPAASGRSHRSSSVRWRPSESSG